MANTPPVSSNVPAKRTYSCIRCANRKVKCDRNTPCSTCVRHNVDCVFNPSQPPRNRHKRLNTKMLTDRLRYYEALLRDKGIDPDKLHHVPNCETRPRTSHVVPVSSNELPLQVPPPIEAEPRPPFNGAQVIQGPGRFKLIDNILWTRMVEEFHDPQDALGDFSDDPNDPEASDDEFSFLFGDQPKPGPTSRHPPPEGIHQLWQTFIENVDPLTKVVHVPTLRPAIEKAANSIEAIPRNFEALMFAIYSAAVMSLTDEECIRTLGEPRKVLLTRYTSATKAALSCARFMGTTSLVVLQALIIHLVAVRDIYEPRAIWSLTGVAVRLAQGMGLERDGVYLGLPPFETEMRRRIWWQLRMHDFRTAELIGVGKFQNLHTGTVGIKWPTNINDDQFFPGMTSSAMESSKLTDVVFISLKCELLNYAADRVASFRRRGKTSNPWDPQSPGSDTAETDESFREIEELLESKYLRYCDPSQPLHLMAMLTARCSINIIHFMAHHPRRWASREQTPLSERQWVWEICIRLLEQHNMLQSNPQLKRFAWYAPYYQQWHAIIHILDTLRADPLNADADKAWRYISSTYENNPDMAFDMRKPIHIAVGNLCLKAYAIREAARQNENTRHAPIPDFIVQLRQQREAAKARGQERCAKSGQTEELVSNNHEHTLNNNSRLGADNSINDLSDTVDPKDLKQSTKSLASGLIPEAAPISLDMDSSLFTFGFDEVQVGDMNDVNMHPAFMLDQDYGVEDSAAYSINWDQWDSWLADSNVIRPLMSKEDFATD